MRCNRRRFLAAVGAAGFAGLAGCSLPSSPDDNSTDAPTTEPPETVPVTTVDNSGYDLSVGHDIENWPEYEPEWSHPVDPPNLDVETETVIEGLEIPWDLSFAPNGDLFISERVGRISRYAADDLETVATPDVIDHADSIAPDEEGGWWEAGSEGGLMGTAVHPNYPDVPLVYAIYTHKDEPAVSGGDAFVNRVSYFDVSADDPGESETVVVDDIPGNEIIHNGARLTFGPENYLWVTTGDAASINPELGTNEPLPQILSSLAGKVLRLEPDGSAPADNPNLGGDPRVYTYGHRNPQAITFLPDGTPVENEHGPGGHDEVNILTAGGNYGWDVEGERARTPETYRGSDYARPVVNTENETWAPPGSVFFTADSVPSWQNRLVIGGLRSQRINLVTIYPTDGEPASAENGGTRYDADWMDSDYSAVHHVALDDELGRIRHVEQGPDGTLYAITSNRDGRATEGFPVEGDDRLVRITPA